MKRRHRIVVELTTPRPSTSRAARRLVQDLLENSSGPWEEISTYTVKEFDRVATAERRKTIRGAAFAKKAAKARDALNELIREFVSAA